VNVAALTLKNGDTLVPQAEEAGWDTTPASSSTATTAAAAASTASAAKTARQPGVRRQRAVESVVKTRG
jgi:hypothetical protein